MLVLAVGFGSVKGLLAIVNPIASNAREDAFAKQIASSPALAPLLIANASP